MFLGYVFFLVLIFNLVGVLTQDCRFYGQSCSDDFSCCGGCCVKGICKDTYMDCRKNAVEDPCTGRYCPEDQICFTYQPPGCKGCGLIVECRNVPLPKELAKNKTHTHFHLVNSSESLRLGLVYFSFGTFIVIFIL